MAFASRFPNRCKTCGRAISVGEMINWDRTKRGVVWHASCSAPAGSESHAPTPPPAKSALVSPPKDSLARSPRPSPSPSEGPTKITLESLVAALKSAGLTLPAGTGTSSETTEAPSTEVPETGTVGTEVSETPSLGTLASNAKWYEVFNAALPFTDRLLLIGPPSSGKSTTAMLEAGIEYRITMTETTSREDLCGMFHLVEGSTKWIDGPITAAMREGKPVLIDEIDRYSPECASLLYSVIDDKPHLSLSNGELLAAKEGFKVIMTSNESLETLPVAVQDRIEVILIAQEPHEAAISDFPSAGREVCLRHYRSQPVPMIHLFPTVRRLKAFYKLTSVGFPAQLAAECVFGKAGASELLSVLTSSESNS